MKGFSSWVEGESRGAKRLHADTLFLIEALEPKLLLSGDLIGGNLVAPLEVSPVEQAIQIDLGQEDQQLQESDPSLILSQRGLRPQPNS